jgi:putative membrane protein
MDGAQRWRRHPDHAAWYLDGRSGGVHRRWDDMMWDGAPAVFMWIWLVFGLLLLVLLVVGVIWLVRSIAAGGGNPPPSSWSSGSGSAREELDRRYARGEITREEYQRIRADLEAPGG